MHEINHDSIRNFDPNKKSKINRGGGAVEYSCTFQMPHVCLHAYCVYKYCVYVC